MTKFLCATCGTQFPDSARAPESCPICEDERQFVGWNGQEWTSLEELQSGGEYANEIRKEEKDLYSIITRPEFAIGQRAFLVQTPRGNVLWDCLPYIDRKTIDEVKKLGGIALIAVSHPHYYSSMVEWSESFGDASIYLHELDKKWVMNPSENIKFWNGESTLTPIRGIKLANLGGHFDGGTVLHWPGGAEGRGVILSGDIITVAHDRRFASFMYSYPNLIPLSERKINEIARRVGKFKFDRLYGAFEGQKIKSNASEAVKKSAKRYVDHIRD